MAKAAYVGTAGAGDAVDGNRSGLRAEGQRSIFRNITEFHSELPAPGLPSSLWPLCRPWRRRRQGSDGVLFGYNTSELLLIYREPGTLAGAVI
jgi:hypothetical protein